MVSEIVKPVIPIRIRVRLHFDRFVELSEIVESKTFLQRIDNVKNSIKLNKKIRQFPSFLKN